MRRLFLLAALLVIGQAAAADARPDGALPSYRLQRVPLAVTPSQSRFPDVPVGVTGPMTAAPFNVPRTVMLPTGWRARVWARVAEARFAAWSPEGELVVTSPGIGVLVELVPGRNPAAAPTERILASSLNEPQGLAFDTVGNQHFLYVAEDDQIDRYVWKNGSLGTRTVLLSGLPAADPSGTAVHVLKGIVVDAEHTIYFTVGSANNANPSDLTMKPPRGAVYSYKPGAGAAHPFATGIRNGEGLAIAPDGTLWAAVNERDDIAYPFHRPYGGHADGYGKVIPDFVDDNPPDEIARLSPGRNLGWPYCNPDVEKEPGNPAGGDDYNHPRFDPDAQANPKGRAFDCSRLAPIDRPIPAHSAPLGLTFLGRSRLPVRWRGGALVAIHGSFDRQVPLAPAVLWLPWNAAKRSLGEPMTLLTGFQQNDNRWGRPVDAVPGPDGALYVTDDYAGAIYRLTPPGLP